MTGTRPAAPPVYLDHNATTPVDERVLEAMLPFFRSAFGNASSVEHRHGNEAQSAVAAARAQVARSLGARENEIVLTGGCTEASNMAILGAAQARPDKRHVVTSAVEHPAVLEPMRQLEREGWDVTVLPVDEHGLVSPDDVAAAIRDDTSLVSIMAANNEVGTIQPFGAIGEECERRGVLFHTDLAQILATATVDVVRDHVHLASVSGHKAYGPKGVGALYVRSRSPRARMAPITFGGGQERGLRPGTINVPLVVGLGAALEIARAEGRADGERLRGLTSRLLGELRARVDGIRLNGHPTERLPGNLSVSIDGVEPLALMHRLNEVASFSASSACSTDKVQTSHVLLAMFGDTPRARQAFRVSPGRATTQDEMDMFAEAVIRECADLRRMVA